MKRCLQIFYPKDQQRQHMLIIPILSYNIRFWKIMYRVLFICFLISCVVADCPLNPYPRRTVVGNAEVMLDNDPNLHGTEVMFEETLQEQFQSSKISVAVGIVGLHLNSHNRVNYIIKHKPSGRSDKLDFAVTVVDNQWGWRSIQFNYLATTQQSLFQAGSQTVNQFSIGLEETSLAIYRLLPNMDNFRVEPVVRVFLAGAHIAGKPLQSDSQYQTMLSQYESFKSFSTNQQLLQYFSNAIEDKKTLQVKIYDPKILSSFIGFSVGISKTTELYSLTFSYVLFSNVVISEKHDYISGNFVLADGGRKSISTLNNMGMNLMGIQGMHIPRDYLYELGLKFTHAFGQGQFEAQTSHSYIPAEFQYLAMQMTMKYVCEDCPDSPIIYQQFCVQNCPRGFSVTQRLDNQYCDKCSVDKLQVVDPDTQECRCAKRHYWNATQDTCMPCPYDCYTCNRGDQCASCDNPLMQTGRTFNGAKRCACPAIGFYDNQAAEDIVCHACHPTCRTCSGPRSHDCLTCTSGKELDSQGHCICSNNYIETAPGICTCNPPNFLYQGFCVDPNEKCGQNQVQQFVDVINKCVCKPGTYQVLNKCIACPANSMFDTNDLQCKCQNNTILKNGKCVACGANQMYDSVYKICVCALGSFKADDGSCVLCGPKQAYINGKCQCIYNYFEASEGVCRRCLRETDGPRCRRNVF